MSDVCSLGMFVQIAIIAERNNAFVNDTGDQLNVWCITTVDGLFPPDALMGIKPQICHLLVNVLTTLHIYMTQL